MKKCFKEEETQKLKLSEYLTYKDSDFKYLICDEGKRIPRTKYIIETLGDVEMDMDTYKLFIGQFQSLGGRYDVRTKPETIKGIYDISQKYQFLSADALEEIWFVYIHDQFEEYALDENTELKNSINHYAEKTGITFDAVERNIRTYMNHIYQNYDYTALCNLFNYNFKPNGGNKVFLKEFIAVLKYTLDNESE